MIALRGKNGQRGVALIVVLLLVATLSFIALAISEQTALAARRSSNTRLNAELYWRAVGAEALARRAIETTMKATPGKLVTGNPLTAAPIEVPFDGGAATMSVVDRTRCFNVNSLVKGGRGEEGFDEEAAEELDTVFTTAGVAEADAGALAGVIADWIDANDFQEPQGAEDGLYTALPTPYRTGSTLLADISELRAMAGVGRLEYGVVRPYLCALPTSDASIINLNLLTTADAPLLVGILNGKKTLLEAQDIINARPPGGYQTIEAFWEGEAFAGLEISAAAKARFELYSRYLEVNAAMEYYGATLDLALLFEVDGNGSARLISRRFGRYE
jgi:general secretion pathway protein K